MIKDLNPNEVGSGSPTMFDVMFNLKAALDNILGVSEEEWEKIYLARETNWAESIKEEVKHREEIKNSNPRIGMTREEVIISKWGRPETINKTTMQYGTSEQWVYPSLGYVYFDNGYVTAIQEEK